MTYFSLRKHDPEPDPEETEEEQPEEAADEPAEDTPARAHGSIATGLLGPGQWIAARFGAGPAVGAHVVAVWAIGFYGGWVAVGVIAVWAAMVLLFIPREAKDRLSAALERRSTRTSKPSVAPAPGGEREAVRRLLLDVMGDAHGVHLKTVLAHLQEHGQWEDKKVADLRVHLEALGIPVDPKLRVAGVPTRGVLRTALEALPPIEETSPSPTPSPPV